MERSQRALKRSLNQVQRTTNTIGQKDEPTGRPLSQTAHASFLDIQARISEGEIERGNLGSQLERLQNIIDSTRVEMEANMRKREHLQSEFDLLRPQLCWRCDDRSDSVCVLIMGMLGIHRVQAALVCRLFRDSVIRASQQGMYQMQVLCGAIGGHCRGQYPVGHSILCTTEGVFTWGTSPDSDYDDGNERLGRPVYETNYESDDGIECDGWAPPRAIPELAGKRVISAAAGMNSTIVCTENGEMWEWGKRSIGHREGALAVPQRVCLGHKVVQVATGSQAYRYDRYDNVVICTEAGLVLTNGGTRIGWTLEEGGLSGLVAVRVAAGGSHLMACTAAGRLFTWGSGSSGRLGHNSEDNEPLSRMVETVAHRRIVDIAAGSEFSIVLDHEGEVLTFGWGGEDGRGPQLGHGDDQNELVPRVVTALLGRKVVGVIAGMMHVLAYTEAGELYSFGEGASGQLGHDDCESQILPKMVNALVGKRVVGAASGPEGLSSMIWTEDQTVYTWGENSCYGHCKPEALTEQTYTLEPFLQQKYNRQIEARMRRTAWTACIGM